MKKFFKKRKWLVGVLSIVIGVVSYFLFFTSSNKSDDLKYETIAVTRGDIQTALSVDGKIIFDTWNLEFLNSGVVKSVNVKLGDKVEKDQILAVLDAANETDRVAQSQAELNSSVATRDNLSTEGIDYKIKKKVYSATKDKLDDEEDLYDEYVDEYGKSSTQARAQKVKVTSAESDVKIAKKQLEQVEVSYENAKYQVEKSRAAYRQSLQAYDDYEITAPVGGAMVAQINGSEGSVILNNNNNTTEPFIVLVDPESYWFEAYVEDVEALKITQDMKAYITLDAYPDDELEGHVIFVSPVAELDNNDLATYKVLIAINDTNKVLLDDMFGGVNLVSEEVSDVLKIPNEAVTNKNGVQYVIIETENGFEEKKIQIEFTNGKEVEVVSGINEGDKIVVIK